MGLNLILIKPGFTTDIFSILSSSLFINSISFLAITSGGFLLAFDKNLNRIGYGKGYYDRNLRKISRIKKKNNIIRYCSFFSRI